MKTTQPNTGPAALPVALAALAALVALGPGGAGASDPPWAPAGGLELAQFESRPATIIRTRQSLARGASFINYTIVSNLNACLVECLITEQCDTAVYQEAGLAPARAEAAWPPAAAAAAAAAHQDVDDDDQPDNSIHTEPRPAPRPPPGWWAGRESAAAAADGTASDALRRAGAAFACYLFECAKPDGFQCEFSQHNYFVSSVRSPAGRQLAWGPRPSRHGRHQRAHRRRHEQQLAHISQQVHYARAVGAPPPPQLERAFHDSRVASIHVARGQSSDMIQGGLRSALVALAFGLAATGTLIALVANKMKSIRTRLAHKARRRSLVPDADFLINTIPI